MTSLSLLLWIVLGIALQLGLFLCVSFWRHWQSYTRLKQGRPEADEPVATVGLQRVDGPGWTGFRPFKVARRVIEDPAGQICSFYLEPEDRPAASCLQARPVPHVPFERSQGRRQRHRANHPLLFPVGRPRVRAFSRFDQAGAVPAEERSSPGAILQLLPRPCSGRHDTASPRAFGTLPPRTGQQPHRPDRRRHRHHAHARHAQLVPGRSSPSAKSGSSMACATAGRQPLHRI
jgi:hypothetical protein